MDESAELTDCSLKDSVSDQRLGYGAIIPWPVTVTTDWLEKGVLIIPQELSKYMTETNTIHILYDQVDEILPYEENQRIIEGLNNFYSAKAVSGGDIVYLQLRAIEPIRLFVYKSATKVKLWSRK